MQVSKKGLYSSVSRTHLGVAVRLSLRVALHLYHRLRHLLVARLRVARHRLSHGLRGHRLPHHLSTTGLRMGGVTSVLGPTFVPNIQSDIVVT